MDRPSQAAPEHYQAPVAHGQSVAERNNLLAPAALQHWTQVQIAMQAQNSSPQAVAPQRGGACQVILNIDARMAVSQLHRMPITGSNTGNQSYQQTASLPGPQMPNTCSCQACQQGRPPSNSMGFPQQQPQTQAPVTHQTPTAAGVSQLELLARRIMEILEKGSHRNIQVPLMAEVLNFNLEQNLNHMISRAMTRAQDQDTEEGVDEVTPTVLEEAFVEWREAWQKLLNKHLQDAYQVLLQLQERRNRQS